MTATLNSVGNLLLLDPSDETLLWISCHWTASFNSQDFIQPLKGPIKASRSACYSCTGVGLLVLWRYCGAPPLIFWRLQSVRVFWTERLRPAHGSTSPRRNKTQPNPEPLWFNAKHPLENPHVSPRVKEDSLGKAMGTSPWEVTASARWCCRAGCVPAPRTASQLWFRASHPSLPGATLQPWDHDQWEHRPASRVPQTKHKAIKFLIKLFHCWGYCDSCWKWITYLFF